MSTRMITWRAGRAGVAALALAVAAPAAGSAGNGVRLGGSEGRLHPFLEVEDRYDSNVYYTDPTHSVGDMVLHVRPGFELAVPGDLAAAEMSASFDWAQYMGLDVAQTRTQLSKMYGQASLGVVLNRRGVLGLELDDDFRRAPGSTAFILSSALISTYNTLRLRAPYRPGGGALVFSANGSWTLETFDSYFTDGSLKALAYNELRAGGDVKWHFLPRTSATFQAGWFSHLPNNSFVSKVSGFEGSVGFTGLVTPHVGATLKAGYTGTFGVTPENANAIGVNNGGTLLVSSENVSTWLATVEGEWMATDSANVKVGWSHGLGIDPGPALFTAHRVYASGRMLLAGRYAARLDGSFETRGYAPGSASASLVRIEPAFEAGIARWMSATVGYAFTQRTSSNFAVAGLPGFDFSKNEVWLRLGVRY